MAYVKSVWSTGDTVTASLANNWEQGIESAHNTVDAHVAAAAPHSGHETPAGAQTKVDAHANLTNNPHGVTAIQAGAAPSSHVGAGGTAHSAATTSVAGFMSAGDKSKLDGIEVGAKDDMTASEILAAIKTVDGAGSGLDADLWQGVNLGTPTGSGSLTGSTSLTIDHNLGRIPIVIVAGSPADCFETDITTTQIFLRVDGASSNANKYWYW